MNTLTVKIRILSPTLLAATPPASNLSETLLFIPGNTLRGVLARRYLAQNDNTPDADFQALFITGQTRFGFGLPDGAGFLPLSARSCKYDGGFYKDGEHGVVDLLLQDRSELRCAYEKDKDKCNAPIDYFKGFWHARLNQKTEVNTRLITRTAIDPQRGTAYTGKLYSQRVLEEEQCFIARIESPDVLLNKLATLLAEPFTTRIGTGASRGQGWVQVSMESISSDTVDYWETANARYTKYKKALNGTSVLAVTMLSDGLFHDDYLRDLTAPKLEHLQVLGINLADWQDEPERAFMDIRLLSGFDGHPINLPRQQRLAIAAGSVFLFKSRQDVTAPTIPDGSGIGWIGDGNREGYGYAALWHPFHLKPDQPASIAIQSGSIAVASQESRLIRKSQMLYREGYSQISKAQMAAVADTIRRSKTYAEAQKEAVKYLEEQLQKLRKKIERGADPSSWARGTASDQNIMLGELLIDWIKQEKYLLQSEQDDLAKLKVLRTFWNRFHGFHRYKAQTNKDMKLKEAGG